MLKKTSKTACAAGMDADRKTKNDHQGVFLRKSCFCTINCDDCEKPRVVFHTNIPTEKEEKEETIEQIEIEWEKAIPLRVPSDHKQISHPV